MTEEEKPDTENDAYIQALDEEIQKLLDMPIEVAQMIPATAEQVVFWEALQLRLLQSGRNIRTFGGVCLGIGFIIVLFSFPDMGLALILNLILFCIWAIISDRVLRVKLNTRERQALLAVYNDQLARWQYEYNQLREQLMEAVRVQNRTQVNALIREMKRYMKRGIKILNTPRMLEQK